MFLSALTLAAILQAAPEITLKGHLPDERPSSRALSAGELTATPRKARPPMLGPSQVRSQFARPAQRAFRKAPPATFVRSPQMVNCKSASPELIANAETVLTLPLSKLPKAHGERAVVRMVDGCPVAVMIAEGPVER